MSRINTTLFPLLLLLPCVVAGTMVRPPLGPSPNSGTEIPRGCSAASSSFSSPFAPLGQVKVVRTLAEYQALPWIGSNIPAPPCDFATQMLVFVGMVWKKCMEEELSVPVVCYTPDAVAIAILESYPKTPPVVECQLVVEGSLEIVVDQSGAPIRVSYTTGSY